MIFAAFFTLKSTADSHKKPMAYWLFFCLVIIALFGIIPKPIGLFILIFSFILQYKIVALWLFNRKGTIESDLAPLFLFGYYLISLTAIYYIFGLTRPVLAAW